MYFWIMFNFILYIFTFVSKKYVYFIWIFLALFSAFRYNIGPDYLQYVFTYDKILEGNDFFLLGSDVFHTQLIYFTNYIGGNIQLVVFIYAILTIYFYYYAFKFFSKNNLFFIIITLFFISMMYFLTLNTIRQTLAAAIFFYSTKFIIQQKIYKYFFFIIIATLVHKSAILLFPFYWIGQKKFSTYSIMIIIILMISLIFINPINLIEVIFIKFNLPFAIYFDYGRFSEPPTLYGKITAFISITMLLLLLLMNRKNKIENLIFNFLLVLAFIRVISLNMDVIGRLSFYFKPFQLLLYVHIFYLFILKIKSKKNIFALITTIFLFSFSLLQLYIIIGKSNAYNQYAININLFSNPEPIQIFGDYKKVQKWEK